MEEDIEIGYFQPDKNFRQLMVAANPVLLREIKRTYGAWWDHMRTKMKKGSIAPSYNG